MDSPSAQLLPQPETSVPDFDEPPSSPFVTEVGAQSRSPSKHWHASVDTMVEADTTMQSAIRELDAYATSTQFATEDKENLMTEPTATLNKFFAFAEKQTPPELRPSTPQNVAPSQSESQSSRESSLMPRAPSRGTPKKTPLKLSRSGANTPRRLSRGHSFEREQSANTFQAALDARSSMVAPQDHANVDDTCNSAFSEIPDTTVFAKLGQPVTKRMEKSISPAAHAAPTPRTSRKRSSASRSPSPTPRRQKTPSAGKKDETTSFLIDFTQQMEGFPGYQLASPCKSATDSNLLQYINGQRSPNKSTTRSNYATPSKPNNILNLLDFELPPAPTPRSVPTITVRELESLKSSYLSQISSLKATLSGREAEVESLKKAVIDAECRVGEAQQALHEEHCRREQVEQEKADWEKRGKEVESVLKSVKEEVMKGEIDRDETMRKLEESEKRADDAESRAVKAEERFADALSTRVGSADNNSDAVEEQVQRLVTAQIDAKIEAVSRELHTVYKEKHERKVATLKKSYETRSERKCADLQFRVSELEKQNEDLASLKEATFSGPVSSVASGDVQLKAQLEEHRATLARLESEIQTSRQQQEQTMRELQQERIEKGDLVAAVDEMLALQAEQGPAQGAMSVVEDFRKSISRPSGLRAPGVGLGGESRIGRAVPTPAGTGRSTNAGVGKSKMLANIERMGRAGNNSFVGME